MTIEPQDLLTIIHMLKMAESNPACSICLEPFRDPVTIPCNHVFCSGCLKRHEEKNAREGIFACPLCNREVTITPPKVSRVINDATDDKDVSMKDISAKCDVCGPNVLGTSRCLECEENYCQVCSGTHIKMKASRNHTLRELGVLYQDGKVILRYREFCPKHPEEEIKIVCKSCKNIPLCLCCKISEHDRHTSKMLSEEVVEIKSALETNMTLCAVRLEQLKACTNEIEALYSKMDNLEQEEVTTVNKQEQELIRLLEAQKVKIKQEAQNIRECIRQVYLKSRQEIDVCKQELAKDFLECAALHNETKILIDTAKESQIVRIGCHVRDNLSRESNRTGTIKLIGIQCKAFTPAGHAKQQLVMKMGNISSDITKNRKMNIFLRSSTKEEPMQLLESEPFETISALRKRVGEKYSLHPKTKLVLKFGPKELSDVKRFADDGFISENVRECGISNGSIIECIWTE